MCVRVYVGERKVDRERNKERMKGAKEIWINEMNDIAQLSICVSFSVLLRYHIVAVCSISIQQFYFGVQVCIKCQSQYNMCTELMCAIWRRLQSIQFSYSSMKSQSLTQIDVECFRTQSLPVDSKENHIEIAKYY